MILSLVEEPPNHSFRFCQFRAFLSGAELLVCLGSAFLTSFLGEVSAFDLYCSATKVSAFTDAKASCAFISASISPDSFAVRKADKDCFS